MENFKLQHYSQCILGVKTCFPQGILGIKTFSSRYIRNKNISSQDISGIQTFHQNILGIKTFPFKIY